MAGTPQSQWDSGLNGGAGDPTIQGFATDQSVNAGSTIRFKISTDAAAYNIEIYRLGYYGGKGARLLTTIQPSAKLPQTQPACLTDSTTGLLDCGNWALSASWAVPANAVSGIYFAHLVRTDTGGASHIFFVVRNDGNTSDLVFQTSDQTWQAYNVWGGQSLYGCTSDLYDLTCRAYKVSYNRPYRTREDSTWSWVLYAEFAGVQFLEANGYNVTYIAGVDTFRSGNPILNHKVYLSVGHDEYWTAQQRASVEAARAAGVNLAFMSGNEIFWKTRYENSIDGSNTPYRTFVCYKETDGDQQIDPLDPPTWTGTWMDPTFSPPSDGGRPQNALTGTLYRVNADQEDPIVIPSQFSKLRFWRNTAVASLTSGQSYSTPVGTLGMEIDDDEDNGFRPAGLFDMSSSTDQIVGDYLVDYGVTYGNGTVVHSLTLYRYQGLGLVFGAGTVQWTFGLNSNHDYNDPPGPANPVSTDAAMQQATVNLLADMGAQPVSLQAGLKLATQSTDTTAPTSTIKSPANGTIVTPNSPLTVTGTAKDTGGGVVAGVEVSIDGGNTWHPGSGTSSWTYTFTPSSGASYIIQSRAVDDSGNLESPSAGVTVGTTTTVPAAPVGLTADAGNQTVTLSWSASVGATGYNVERGSKTGGPYTIIASGVAGTVYIDSGLTNGTTYYYVVTAGDLSGQSPISNQASAKPQQPIANCSGCYTIWQPSATPGTPDFTGDPSSVELGVVFQTDTGGYINGIRFYKGTGNTGTHIGNLWTSQGTNLASAIFTSETASGWQQVNFASPVPVTANTTYIASYFAPNGNYARDANYFASSGVYNSPLDALSNAQAGGNGVYAYNGTSSFPSFTSGDAPNYWVDVVFTTSSGTISAPSALVANANNARVTLDWNGTGGGSTYAVQRSTVSGGPYATLATGVTATRYVDTSVVNGTTYYYVVAATNSSGTSPNSAEVNATPAQPIAGCTTCFTIWQTTAAPGNPDYSDSTPVELGVVWQAESNGVVLGVRFYKGTGNTGTHIGNLWTTSGTNLGTARFSGESASGWQQVLFSSPVSVTANTPYIVSYFAPNGNFALDQNYFTSAGTDNSPLLALSTPASGGNGVFTYSSTSAFPSSTYASSNYWVDVIYEPITLLAPTGVTAKPGSTQVTLTWNAVSGATSYNVQRSTTSGGPYTIAGQPSTTTFTDTGLTNGTTYYYVVAAVNASGTSPNSVEVNATPNGVPSAPGSLSATPGNAQVTLSWKAVSNATSYNVQRSTTNGGPYTTVGNPTTNSFSDTGVSNGTTYYYVVAAVNSAGTSGNSSQVSATPNAVPNAPSGLKAAPGTAQVMLSWTAVSNATSYNVQRSGTSGGPYALIGTATTNSYTDSNLTNGTTYYYVVAAVNSVGTSSNSGEVSGTPNVLPSAPTGVTATAGDTRVTLSWTGVSNATSYIVQRSTTSGSGYATVGTPTTNRFTDTGLTDGTTYYYVVAGVDSVGTGPNSTPVSVTPIPVPTAPQNLMATPGNALVTLTWTASTGATSYNVQRSTTNGSGYTNIGTPSTNGFSDTSVTNGTIYYYVVAAVNSAGTSANSGQVSATPNGVPSAPTGLMATPGSGLVTLSWTASTGATSYNVLRSTTNGGPYASVGTPTTNSFTNTGLTNGTTYYYVVAAANSAGSSGNSSQVSATPGTALSAPSNLMAAPGNALVTLSWTAVTGAASYNVQRSTTSGGPYASVGTPTTNSFTNTGLTNGTTYYYVVSAVNGAGSSPNSGQVSAIPNIVPGQTTGLAATPGNALVTLNWTAVSGAASYNVQRSTTNGSGYASVGTPSTNSFTDTNLTNGTTYYYVVAAVNSAGTGPNSGQVSAIPNIVPSAPSGLTATPGNAQVSLSWTAVSNAASYSVLRSTTNGGPYTLVASPTTNTYTNTGLTNGTTYYYVVAAVNSVGTSSNSGQVSATPPGSAGPSCPPCFSIFSSSATPGTPDNADPNSVELGVVFETSTNGYVMGIRFYKGTKNTGTHIGNLWDPSGNLLATATFTGETASGWQQVNFATPVAVTANTPYTASYFAPKGNYALDLNYFGSGGISNPPLQALSNLVAPVGNGMYVYSTTSSFPTSTYSASNYWVDVVFETTAPQTLKATVASSKVSLSWAAVSGATSYNVKRSASSGGPYTTIASPTTTTYTDSSTSAGTTYYYVVTAVTSQGESPISLEVAAVIPPSTTPTCPCSTIWASTAKPGTPDLNSQTVPIELGVVFQSASNGYILGIRFYKGTGNTGTHIGNLWSANGTLLATATFTGETASGWQQVNFANPVPVTANTTYVASYFAPNGNFARDGNYFTSSGVSNPPLSALSNALAITDGQPGNGIYVYTNTSNFPIYSSGDGPNYWVDVVFHQ